MTKEEEVSNYLIPEETKIDKLKKEIDPNQYESEWDELMDYLVLNLKNLDLSMGVAASKKTAERWSTLANRRQALVHHSLDHVKVVDDNPNVNKKAKSLLDLDENGILHTGAAIAYVRVARELTMIAGQEGFFNRIGPVFEAETIILARDVLFRVNDFSIMDFVDKGTLKKTPLEKAYGFLVELSSDRDPAIELETDSSPLGRLSQKYPTITQQTLLLLPNKVVDLINFRSVMLKDAANTRQNSEQEVVKAAMDVLDNVWRVRTEVYKNLLNPTLPNSQMIRERVLMYLQHIETTKQNALYIAGISNQQRAIEAYRKSIEQVLTGQEFEFYSLLATNIKGLMDQHQSVVPTKDDVDTFISEPEKIETAAELTLSDLAPTVKGIFAKNSNLVYEIPPTLLAQSGIATPETILIQFNKNNPQIFALYFVFRNEFDETIEMQIDYDLKKNFMDWWFLESSDDPEMGFARKAFISATDLVLTGLKSHVDRQYEEKKYEEKKSEGSRGGKVIDLYSTKFSKQPYVPDEWRKELKQHGQIQRPESPLSLDSLRDAKRAAEEGIKNHIVLPPEEEIIALVENLGAYDREIVLKGVAEYNERGVGGFTRKRARDDEGAPIYTLRINTQVPGGVRVLLREVNSVKGHRYYEIVDIRYRKDIYRKNKI